MQMADQEEATGFAKALEVLTLVWEIIYMHVLFYAEIFKSIYKFFMPPEPKDVKNEIILITGTGHGMGREVALRFAKLGATVVCVDINAKGNEETCQMIKQEKGKAFKYECDVTDKAAVLAMAEKVRKEVGDVTILVNNAGIMPCKSLLDHSDKEVRAVMEVNVIANIWMLQAFLPAMMERNYGHIVAMSSMAGLMGNKNLVPYAGSKYAVRGIMESLAVELRQDERNLTGIKFTTVYPYIVNTGLCHKPRIRFQATMGVVEPGDAADQIVDAVRREYLEITIPSHFYYTNKFMYRTLPMPAASIMQDFSGTYLEAHD